MEKRLVLFGGICVLAGLFWWASSDGALEASDLKRNLSDFRLERGPFGQDLPPAWQAELEQTIAQAPEVSLLDPAAPALAAEVLRKVSWIDPDSVFAQLKMPEGLQVEFLPRRARFLMIVGGRPTAVLASDGVVLPDGLPASLKSGLMQLAIPAGDRLPLPGHKISSPLALEALRAWAEIVQMEELSHLVVHRIQIKNNYTNAVRSVVPPLSLILSDGREIEFGRSDASRDPLTPGLDVKMARLGSVLRQYPGLKGVQVVSLDHPDQAFVLDSQYLELPLDTNLVLVK
jgi:hypothetical protein